MHKRKSNYTIDVEHTNIHAFFGHSNDHIYKNENGKKNASQNKHMHTKTSSYFLASEFGLKCAKINAHEHCMLTKTQRSFFFSSFSRNNTEIRHNTWFGH